MRLLFDPERLDTIVQRSIGLPHELMMERLITDLASAYPGAIEERQDWFFSLTAGAVGLMHVLHASLGEYLLLFGTPIGTEGFSGRYPLDIDDWVLSGEMWTYTPDRPAERVLTRAGERARLSRGKAKGYRAPDTLWMLEYGRGSVALCLPKGLGDVVWSAMDFTSFHKLLHTYGRLTLRSMLRAAASPATLSGRLATRALLGLSR